MIQTLYMGSFQHTTLQIPLTNRWPGLLTHLDAFIFDEKYFLSHVYFAFDAKKTAKKWMHYISGYIFNQILGE